MGGPLRSLGLSTERMVQRLESTVVERDDYLVVRTPDNPGYFWGNCLVFRQPPEAGALARWERAFERELPDVPPTGHCALTWDHDGLSAPGNLAALEPFRAAGYEYEVDKVLVADAVRPPRYPRSDVQLRALAGDEDWCQQLELTIESRDSQFEEASFGEFAARRQRAHRRVVDSGAGAWYGVFDGRDTLLASAGLFWDEAGALGRFQLVGTRSAARRQGFCGTLVHRLSQWGFGERGLGRLVMIADEDYHAARIYESVGFRPVERLGSLLRMPSSNDPPC